MRIYFYQGKVTTTPPNPGATSISGFSPTHAIPGLTVTVMGYKLSATKVVTLNGMNCPNFVVLSDNALRLTIPSGATSGKIAVTVGMQVALSPTDFTVDVPSTVLPPNYAYAVSPAILEETSSFLAISGAWSEDRGNAVSSGMREIYSATPGNTVTLRFFMRQAGYLDLVQVKDTSLGTATVSIDGGPTTTINQAMGAASGASTKFAPVYTSPLLSVGEHIMVFTVATGTIVFDRTVLRHDGDTVPLWPFDLSFSHQSTTLVSEYLPTNFRVADYGFSSGLPSDTDFTGTFTPSGGTATSSPATSSNNGLVLRTTQTGRQQFTSTGHPLGPWWAVRANFQTRGSIVGGSAPLFQTFFGIAKDANNRIGAAYDANSNFFIPQVVVNGVTYNSSVQSYTPGPASLWQVTMEGTYLCLSTAVAGTESWTLQKAWDFGDLVANGTILSMYDKSYYTGDWKYVLQFDTQQDSNVTCTQEIAEYRAGMFGCTATGDFSILIDKASNTLIRNNKAYIAATLRGIYPANMPNYNLFGNITCGLVSIDLDTIDTPNPVLKLESIAFQDYGDNKLYGDGAPFYWYDPVNDNYRTFTPAYHLYPRVESGTSINAVRPETGLSNTLLSGVNIFQSALQTIDASNPNGTFSDCGAVEINGTTYWGLCHAVQSPFAYNLKLVKTTDFITYTNVFEDTTTGTADFVEGIRTALVGGRPFFFGGGKTQIAVYDPQTGEKIGYIPQPAEVYNQSFPNHGAILSFVRNGVRRYGLVAFDTYYASGPLSYGNTLIYMCPQTETV